MHSCKQAESTVGCTTYIDSTASTYWRDCERSALLQLIDGMTDGVYSVSLKPGEAIMRKHVEDSVTEYLLQRLNHKKTSIPVIIHFLF